MIRIILLFFLFSLICMNVLGEAQVSISRGSVAANETFTLTLTTDSTEDADPDFTPLQKDFEILGTGHKTEFLFSNGHSETKKQWILTLIAKNSGDLTIPAIKYGSKLTKPLRIQVLKHNFVNTDAPENSRDIFMEAEVKPKSVFVQEQIIYTLKLFFRINLEEAFLFPPELTGGQVAPMGQDIIYSAIKNGRQFKVLERNFMITPQQSGNFTIKPAVFRGVTTRESNDIFSISEFARNFRKPIKIIGPTISVAIKPKPKGFLGQWWLPAKNVTIREAWSMNPPRFKVGQPITREITITAKGAKGDQLPPVRMVGINGLNVYPEPQKIENHGDDQNIVGTIKQQFTLIPTQPGKLRLPGVSIPWWNVITHKKQFAFLPERIIVVVPSATIKTKKTELLPQAPASGDVSNPKTSSRLPWVLGLFSLVIVIIFLVRGWLKKFPRNKKSGIAYTQVTPLNSIPEIKTAKTVIGLFEQACKEHNAPAAKQYLIEFSKIKWPHIKIHSLQDMINHFQNQMSQELLSEIIKLDLVLYSKTSLPWEGSRLLTLFTNFAGKDFKSKTLSSENKLPPLYLE